MAPRFPDAAAATHQDAGPSLDPERFAVLTEMCRAPGSRSTIDAIVDAFVEDGDLRVVEMEGSLRARDLAALADLAHELKGSSASVGAAALSALASGLQRQAAAAARRSPIEVSDVEDIERMLDLAVAEFRRAETAFRTALRDLR